MFGISFETWHDVCEAYENLSPKTMEKHLQWYPFSVLAPADWNVIKSREFFEKYIEKGAFVLFSENMFQTKNYIQKTDGSFRDASLVSPILYLVLQSLGKEIADCYKAIRPVGINAYYAGDYVDLNVRYRREYDSFFNEINLAKENYDFYIKTDITSFFRSINIDKLVEQIDEVCNESNVVFDSTFLLLLKNILLFAGDGRFPLIENSISSSYLATIVYLDQIDKELFDYIEKRCPSINNFKMIRYVDDLYILISTTDDEQKLRKEYVDIRNEYSSTLQKWDLSLNSKKCKFGKASEVNEELKKSLYHDSDFEEQSTICNMYPERLTDFLSELATITKTRSLDVEQYNELIEACFDLEDTDFVPDELFNYFVYDSRRDELPEEQTKKLTQIVKNDIGIIALDPKRLGTLVMKTKDSQAIKALLNELFKRNRADKWNSYDTTIAITYLLNSGFRHLDLLDRLEENSEEVYEYYWFNCRNTFLNVFNGRESIATQIELVGNDWIVYFLYFMYLGERKKGNSLTEYSYYKSYFDRLTADIAFLVVDSKDKKPNYQGYYREKSLARFYSCIDGSAEIIKQAHDLRNSSPLNHSSSGLITDDSSTKKIVGIIYDLNNLINEYLRELQKKDS